MLRLFLFVASMMAACTSSAWGWGVSQCPVDTIPIQIVVGARHDPVITLPAYKGIDPPFDNFVKAVTEHVAARLTARWRNTCSHL